MLDKDLTIIYRNWPETQGNILPQKVPRQKHCYAAYPPGQELPCNECHVLEVFSTNSPVVREKRTTKEGCLEILAYPLVDDAGKVSMVLENIRNIEKCKKVEKSLKEVDQMLNAAIQASPLPIIVLDNDEKVMIWNPAAERIFEWEAEDVVGQRYPLLPDEHKEEFSAFSRGLKEDIALNGVELMRRKIDGTIIPIRCYIPPLCLTRKKCNCNDGYP
ncbi:MAG: PAS domain-containing protein [Geobacteraceae bacterium]|nr:PAS domain-containing protein [Geobacteraceae bacterium]